LTPPFVLLENGTITTRKLKACRNESKRLKSRNNRRSNKGTCLTSRMNYDSIALADVHAGRTEVGNNLMQYRGLVLCAIFCMSSQQVFFLYLRLVHFFFP
jgi:hypothetical protein